MSECSKGCLPILSTTPSNTRSPEEKLKFLSRRAKVTIPSSLLKIRPLASPRPICPAFSTDSTAATRAALKLEQGLASAWPGPLRGLMAGVSREAALLIRAANFPLASPKSRGDRGEGPGWGGGSLRTRHSSFDPLFGFQPYQLIMFRSVSG